jgi:probable HAF family extracellular repeat protein
MVNTNNSPIGRPVAAGFIATVASMQLCAAALASPNCPPRYTVEIIQPPTNFGVYPNDLNSTTVVGDYYPSITGSPRAFSWSPQTGFVVLPFPPGTFHSTVIGITEAGEYAGLYAAGNSSYGYLRTSEGALLQFPPPPGATGMHVLGMNSRRQVVGHFTQGDVRAFLWDNGIFRDLAPDLPPGGSLAEDINESGAITGYMGSVSTYSKHAFIWQSGKVTDLGPIPNGLDSYGQAINNLGQVACTGVGPFGRNGELRQRSYLWNGKGMVDMGSIPGTDRTRVYDLNDDGYAVG